MATHDIIQSAAGAASSQAYVEDVFSNYLYTGNGGSQTIVNGLDLSYQPARTSLDYQGSVVGVSVTSIARSSSGLLVAVGYGGYPSYVGYAITSTDEGATWSAPVSLGTQFIATGIAVNSAGLFVATGATGNGTSSSTTTSTDGVNWTGRVSMGGASIGQIAVNSSGLFVTISGSYPSYSARTSTDGVNWTSPVGVSGNDLGAITVSPAGRFVAVGSLDGSNTPGGVTSTDGVNWTGFNVSAGFSMVLATVCVNSAGRFVAAGRLDGSPYTTYFTTSADGITWTTLSALPATISGSGSGIDQDGRFVIAGGFGYNTACISSADGMSWGAPVGYYSPNGGYATQPAKLADGRLLFGSSNSGEAWKTGTIPVDPGGGLVWIKQRSSSGSNALYNSFSGATQELLTDSTAAQTTQTTGVTAFYNTGFDVGALARVNTNGATYGSWSFIKSAKFFDVVNYTGTGSARTIAHSLGQAPGMIIVKSRSAVSNWAVYQRSQTSASYYTKLNLTDAQASDSTVWNDTAPTSSVFSVGTSALTNTSGATYTAFIFGHNTDPDGLIQCGSYTGNGSATGPTITLGWEPQYVMVKCISTTGNWVVIDNMRAMAFTNGAQLFPNASTAETALDPALIPTSTGFQVVTNNAAFNTNAATYMYMAIRRGPMRPPTDATKVFYSNARTGTGAYASVGSGFPLDAVIEGNRSSALTGTKFGSFDRVRGKGYSLTTTTAAEVVSTDGVVLPTYYPWGQQDGYVVGSTSTLNNASSNTFINWMFRRAAGFFDMVFDTGTGTAHTVRHNLATTPEFIIRKSRSATGDWTCWASSMSASEAIRLNETNGKTTDATAWNSTLPTNVVFTVGTGVAVNTNAATYVTYLFATCPGVSKIGSYTGTGAAQDVACGFAAGARFVLIKRLDGPGDWFVWDTARGISASNDPYLALNSVAAEVTNTNYLNVLASGFTITSTAPASINQAGGSYFFFAIA